MKKEFLNFYEEHIKDVIKFNINELVQKELGEKIITLEGVKNYFKVLSDKAEMHKYIIGTIFKYLYEKIDKKPQIFIFFDSIDEINEFHEYFKARVSYQLFLVFRFHLRLKRIPSKFDSRHHRCQEIQRRKERINDNSREKWGDD